MSRPGKSSCTTYISLAPAHNYDGAVVREGRALHGYRVHGHAAAEARRRAQHHHRDVVVPDWRIVALMHYYC